MSQPIVPGLSARKAALQAVNHVLIQGRQLDFNAQPACDLKPADKALARRIALATLRHLGRSDHVLASLAARKPPIYVRNILRMAMSEFFVCGTSSHAAVDLAVRLIAADRRHFRLKGFANAVLRRALGCDGRLRWEAARPSRLPDWIAGPVAEAFGDGALRRIKAVHEAKPPLDLTPKHPGRAEALAAALGAELLPGGSLRLNRAGQVSDLHGYNEGGWWVQDFAASLCVRLLGDLQGKSVLDLCAAPGGKTMQCCAAGADVTALDRSNQRLAVLRANLRRTGLHARIVRGNALSWRSDAMFDSVIVDAPCSASGTIRRHPDLPYRSQDEGWLSGLIGTQRQLLAKAFAHAAPGGQVLYCVCSLLPQEGEHVIGWAREHLGAVASGINCAAIGADTSWLTPEGGIRTRPDYWPDRGGMDGFYAAALIRPASV